MLILFDNGTPAPLRYALQGHVVVEAMERGWDRLVQQKRGATLLALTNELDKNLEVFLSEQKAETVKLTIFKDTRHLDSPSQAASPLSSSVSPVAMAAVSTKRYRQCKYSLQVKNNKSIIYLMSCETTNNVACAYLMQRICAFS